MTDEEYNIIKKILISEFDIFDCYIKMNKWDGYNPKCYDDIYRLIGGNFKIFEKDHYNDMGYCRSGGIMVGNLDNHIFISWSDEIKINEKINLDIVRLKSKVYCEINYIEFFRMYKIYKLWKKKE